MIGKFRIKICDDKTLMLPNVHKLCGSIIKPVKVDKAFCPRPIETPIRILSLTFFDEN